MRTVEELVLLTSETLSLWLRALPRLLFWWGLGFAVHELAILAAALLGAQNRTAATVIFVLGMVAQLVAMILMIHSVRPLLQVPAALAHRPPAAGDPTGRLTGVAQNTSRAGVLSTTLGPFLAVYAVWGLTQTEVSRLVSANLTLHGVAVADWSVQLTDWRFYAVLAVIAWVIRRCVALGTREGRRPILAVVGHVLEGMWVLATFIAAVQLGRDLTTSLSGRRVAQWWSEATATVLGTLGDWFGDRVPMLIVGVIEWVWGTGLPALSVGVALPLMWLALTAAVFGWQVDGRSLVLGTRWDASVGRVLDRTRGDGWAPVRWVAAGASQDLRDKWLPVLNSLRLIVTAGPRFVGAYLVLGATLAALGVGWDWLLLVLGGPLPDDQAIAYEPVRRFLAGLVLVPLQVALYAAAFDRGVADTSGVDWRTSRISRATRVDA